MWHLNKLTSTHTLWVAYSGGLDSSVLLHRLVNDTQGFDIKAIHINHGLSQNANAWEQHCQAICEILNVELTIKKINIEKSKGQSLEAVARETRYQAFSTVMGSNDCLLTAHHQDDQAETLLLQLLRGAGLDGLSAMPALTSFSNGYLYRPLLETPRSELLSYAKENKLHWMEDESNDDTDIDRNYIRHQIMPQLKNRWPSAEKTLSRSASHCASAKRLLTVLAKQDYLDCQGSQANTLSINKLSKFERERQDNVLRFWLKQLKLSMPSTIKLAHLHQNVLAAKQDAMPLLTWPGVEIRRYRDDLYAMPPLPDFDTSTTLQWQTEYALTLPANLGILRKEAVFDNQENIPEQVTVRFRQGGERVPLKGNQGHQALNVYFQSVGIPPWERSRVPLIFHQDQLISLGLA